MSSATVERDIELRMLSQWVHSAIDINPAVPFTTPAPGVDWVKLRVAHGTAYRASLGQPAVIRHEGEVTIEVYTPMGRGSRAGKGYADLAVALFEETQFNGITFGLARVTDMAQHQGRWRTDVVVPFWWDGRYVT